jgi:hypothetical protein
MKIMEGFSVMNNLMTLPIVATLTVISSSLLCRDVDVAARGLGVC